jgi:hypothetical protein
VLSATRSSPATRSRTASRAVNIRIGEDPRLAQPPADLEPVDAGEHQVEDDRVVLDRLRLPQALLAVAGEVDGHPLALEAAPEQPGHLRFVLEDQHAHGESPIKMPAADESRVKAR